MGTPIRIALALNKNANTTTNTNYSQLSIRAISPIPIVTPTNDTNSTRRAAGVGIARNKSGLAVRRSNTNWGVAKYTEQGKHVERALLTIAFGS